jgi:hypothetical protein
VTSADEPESQPAAESRQPGWRKPAAARIPNQRREFDRRQPRRTPPADVAPSGGAESDVAPSGGAESDGVVLIRELARTGELKAAARAANEAERRHLYAAAYAVAYPVVFQVVTQKVERRRGHGLCARGLRHLGGACLDGFYDDVEALIEHLFAATTPIDDLEAWLAYWAPRAAVDGHRKRRGARGALQRPRMTKGLAERLGHDPWLMDLALRILTWVGIPATAGAGVWPLDEWAQQRARTTGDIPGSTPAALAVEVAHVLAVLRQQPDWYADHVECPLGRKPAPVAAPPGDGVADPRPLQPAQQHEPDDPHVTGLAWTALEAIAAGLHSDRDPAETVIGVLTTLFLGGSGVETIDLAPGAGPAHHERWSALLADPAALAVVVERVLRIVREVEH